MKITPEWLAKTKHCADGLSFGLTMLPPEGLDDSECWPLIDRPDFLVSLAVKCGIWSYNNARFAVESVLKGAAPKGDREIPSLIERTYNMPIGHTSEFVREVAALVHASILLGDKTKYAHLLNAVAQLAKADYVVGTDRALALERLQGAAYSLGLNMGQKEATDAIKVFLFAYIKETEGIKK